MDESHLTAAKMQLIQIQTGAAEAEREFWEQRLALLKAEISQGYTHLRPPEIVR